MFGEDVDEYFVKVFNRGGFKVFRVNLNIRGKDIWFWILIIWKRGFIVKINCFFIFYL